MEKGWDPKVTGMFRKIINSVSLTLMWMIAAATAGLYFELAYVENKPSARNYIFYALLIISLLLLIRFLYKTWKNDLKNN